MMKKKEELKAIGYSYLFNYFGRDLYKGKIITGATIDIVIRVFKKGEAISLEEEISYKKNKYLSDIYKVSFDKEKLYVVEKNLYVDNIFRIVFCWDKIDYEVIGFGLDYEINEGYGTEMEVTKEEFEEFLKNHIQDFNISDNQNAQVPSYFIHNS